MEPQLVSLDNVVVTAFGIKREAKALGYSVQKIKGGELTEARENNVLNSLEGKLAGVQINRSGNGPGGSSRIVIRGENSIGGNNQPLIVVDGIPMDSWSGGADSEWGGMDRGNGMADINPDDVESITVLKGPSAAVLYGSRAGNNIGTFFVPSEQCKKRDFCSSSPDVFLFSKTISISLFSNFPLFFSPS